MQAVFGHAARRHIIFNKLPSRPAETARSASRRTISKIEVPAGESLSTSRCRRLTGIEPTPVEVRLSQARPLPGCNWRCQCPCVDTSAFYAGLQIMIAAQRDRSSYRRLRVEP